MKPKFVGRYQLVVDSQGVLICSRERFIKLSGDSVPLVVKALPLLDGTRQVAEIAAALDISLETAAELVVKLAHARLVIDYDDVNADSNAAIRDPFLEAHVVALSWLTLSASESPLQLLKNFRVGILSESRAVAPAFVDSLVRSGITAFTVDDGTLPQGHEQDCLTCIAGHEDTERFREIDRWSRKVGIPWLRVVLEPERVRVGPLFLGGDSACYTCLTTRAVTASPAGDELARYLAHLRDSGHKPVPGHLAGAVYLASGLVALELLKFVTKVGATRVVGWEVDMDVLTIEADLHPVLRVPLCPECSVRVPTIAYGYSDLKGSNFNEGQ